MNSKKPTTRTTVKPDRTKSSFINKDIKTVEVADEPPPDNGSPDRTEPG